MADFYSSKCARRIFVVVTRAHKHWKTAWDAPKEVVAAAFQLVHQAHLVPPETRSNSSTVRLLVRVRGDTVRCLIFDIFHTSYDAATAHLPGRDELPLITVLLDSAETVNVKGPEDARGINASVRNTHNEAGVGSLPPFTADYTNGRSPVYGHPRSDVWSAGAE